MALGSELGAAYCLHKSADIAFDFTAFVVLPEIPPRNVTWAKIADGAHHENQLASHGTF
jgi:hypothetical protein